MPETIKHVPMRKCIACNTSFPQEKLIRITLNGSELNIDEEKRAEGRGCYICNNPKCIKTALKKNAFQKTFRTAIPKEAIERIGRYLNAE